MKDIITILDVGRNQLGVIDDYDSLIWTERYDEAGDFVLELPIQYLSNPYLSPDNFLTIERSDRLMIISKLTPTYDSESGDKLVVEGYSAESILKKRTTREIIFIEDVSVYDIIVYQMNENVITPSNANRTIDFITIAAADPTVAAITTSDQFDIMTVYDFITTACKNTGLGWKLTFDADTKGLILTIYSGVDRSYDQVNYPFVIFSNDYDNVRSGTYVIDTSEFFNVAVVTTNDDVEALQMVEITPAVPEPSGLARVESLVNANDIRRSIPGDVDLTDDEILAIITQRGYDAIFESLPIGLFDGDLDIEGSFVFGRDFFMGDILACDIATIQTSARLTELMISINESGRTAFGSFNFNT